MRAKLASARQALLTPWDAIRRLIAVGDYQEDVAEKIYPDRAIALANMFRVISVAGINTMLLWAIYFRKAPCGAAMAAMFGAGVINYVVLFYKSHAWLKECPEAQDPVRYLREMFYLLICLGIIWALLIISMMKVASPAQTGLVYAMIVAGMSTSVLVAPLSIAFAFWIPVVVGAFISLFCGLQPFNPFALVCLISYTGLTGFATVYLNNRLTERLINAIRVEENAEVIKLLLRDFEENASDWLWETDARLELQHVSARLAQVAGKSAEALAGPFPHVLLGDTALVDQGVGSPIAKLNQCIVERSPFRDLIIPVVVGGEERSWLLTGKPVLDKSGKFLGYHGVGSDITLTRRNQEQIAFLARHDSLTKLPNRVLFNEMLHLSCTRCEQDGLALLCLDLDDFKSVNDTLGHATGDGILIAVSERIRSCIRDDDIAARLGGDEFAILLTTKDIEEVSAVARRIVERVSRPYHFDGRVVEVGVSIGITMAPKDGANPSLLLKNADLALYRAKADGRGTWRLYDLEMDERVQERRSLQSDLRHALARGEFYLNYQPIIDLVTKRIVAVEALLRWAHPERGLLSPVEFIPMAEGAGLIAPIGAWVLRKACAVAALWPDDVRIAVNLSPLQFRDAALITDVDAALEESGLEPSRLELEITESTILETNSQTVDALWQMHKRGIRIALDDFGTGFSSLSYLSRFPFDKIKIDRSFIRGLGRERDDSPIILAIIGLAENMNMVVTAEGVETEEQAGFLTAYRCKQAQGYLFYKPLSATEIGEAIMLNRRIFSEHVQSAAE
jgi:diguanylate cyclase (GGDEF)-like protein